MYSLKSANCFNSIILIGYMGSGKTSIGKKLSKKINFKFIDLDEMIEKKLNKSISQIFTDLGELEFRKIENRILIDILRYEHQFILSLGGGTPCYYDNMNAILSKTKYSIYLKVPLKILSKRLYSRKEKRPILSNIDSVNNMKEFIAKHIFERIPFYEKSNFVIESNRDNGKLVIDKIIEIIKQ
mgnify:CR=1 FL=1